MSTAITSSLSEEVRYLSCLSRRFVLPPMRCRVVWISRVGSGGCCPVVSVSYREERRPCSALLSIPLLMQRSIASVIAADANPVFSFNWLDEIQSSASLAPLFLLAIQPSVARTTTSTSFNSASFIRFTSSSKIMLGVCVVFGIMADYLKLKTHYSIGRFSFAFRRPAYRKMG